jgi:CRISPR-associated protein Csb2
MHMKCNDRKEYVSLYDLPRSLLYQEFHRRACWPREASRLLTKTKPIDRYKPTVVRFLLDGPVLPLVTDTLSVAEAFRQALMGRFQRHCHRRKYGHAGKPYQESFRSETLSGKDAEGQPLLQHRHAYYLPTAEGSDPRWITYVTVAAADGFGDDEVAALNALRKLNVEDESPELRMQLVGLGVRQDFRAPLLDESTVWISVTPFVVTRYSKLRGTKRDRPEDYASPRDFVRHVLQQELKRRPDRPPASIEETEGIDPQRLRPIQFRQFRKKRGDDGGRPLAGGFRITFTALVRGPLCLGHSCHFGLVLFLPTSLALPRVAR